MVALKRLRHVVENGAIEIDNFGMYLGKLIPGLNCQVNHLMYLENEKKEIKSNKEINKRREKIFKL